jgi:hypothetical protein
MTETKQMKQPNQQNKSIPGSDPQGPGVVHECGIRRAKFDIKEQTAIRPGAFTTCDIGIARLRPQYHVLFV